ncbi:MAG: GTPase domain-containing protein [Chloroflexota bacterium]
MTDVPPPAPSPAGIGPALRELDTALVERARRAPDAPERGAAERLHRHVAEYLVPRAADVESPLVVVILGSTGSGKSSLFNALAGWPASPSGILRPTTRRPVVLAAPDDIAAIERGEILPGLASRDQLHVLADRRKGRGAGVVLVDAPDIDSIEAENRRLAAELLEAADLLIVITTASRYADEAPWQMLTRARERGVPMLAVLNRLPTDDADAVAVETDYLHLLERAGMLAAGALGQLEIVDIREGQLDTKRDALSARAIEPIRAALDRLVSGTAERRELAARALGAALEGLPPAVERIAAQVEEERAAASRLESTAAAAYRDELVRLNGELASGTFLRAEVLRQWQEFVGAGAVARLLASGVGRAVEAVKSLVRRQPAAPVVEVREGAFTDVVELTAGRVAEAARRTATEWSASELGNRALAEDAGLWTVNPQLRVELRASLERWAGEIGTRIGEIGEGKRGFARAASLGVNVLGTATVLAVFTTTGGLTGAEVGITAATALLNQKLLEAIFGEATLHQFVSEARDGLKRLIADAVDTDRARFETALGSFAPGAGDAERLRAAVARVEEIRAAPAPA